MMTEKIKTQTELADIARKARAVGKAVGFTNGCFDILHRGHVKYLREAKKECDILIIGVNGDESVKRLKGEGRPVNTLDARMEVLAALECVDLVTAFSEDTQEDLIKSLRPDVLFKGGDWKESDIVGSDHVRSKGGRVRVIPYVEGYSTTELIKRIENRA